MLYPFSTLRCQFNDSKPIASRIAFAAPAAYFKRPYRNSPARVIFRLPLFLSRGFSDKDLAFFVKLTASPAFRGMQDPIG